MTELPFYAVLDVRGSDYAYENEVILIKIVPNAHNRYDYLHICLEICEYIDGVHYILSSTSVDTDRYDNLGFYRDMKRVTEEEYNKKLIEVLILAGLK